MVDPTQIQTDSTTSKPIYSKKGIHFTDNPNHIIDEDLTIADIKKITDEIAKSKFETGKQLAKFLQFRGFCISKVK